MSAQAVGAARAAERIELVDEDDCRRALARLLEQVANASGADADEHLDELGAVNGEKRHAGLARDCAREQRLACSGRPDQQHALRDVSAEPRIALRILEEADDFLQFLLRLVDARYVIEGHLGIGLDIDPGLALAYGEEAGAEAALSAHAAGEKDPDSEKDQRWRDERQDVA